MTASTRSPTRQAGPSPRTPNPDRKTRDAAPRKTLPHAPVGAVSVKVLATECGVAVTGVYHWLRMVGSTVHPHSAPHGEKLCKQSYLHAEDAQAYRAHRAGLTRAWNGLRPVSDQERSVPEAADLLGTTAVRLARWLKYHPKWQVRSTLEGGGWNVTAAAMDAYRQEQTQTQDAPQADVQPEPELSQTGTPADPLPRNWTPIRDLAGETGRSESDVRRWLKARTLSWTRAARQPAGRWSLSVAAPESANAYRAWAALHLSGQDTPSGRRERAGTQLTAPPPGWLNASDAAVYCGCSSGSLNAEVTRQRYAFAPVRTPAGDHYDPDTLQALRAAHRGRRPAAGWISMTQLTNDLQCNKTAIRDWTLRTKVAVREFKAEDGALGNYLQDADAQAFREHWQAQLDRKAKKRNSGARRVP